MYLPRSLGRYAPTPGLFGSAGIRFVGGKAVDLDGSAGTQNVSLTDLTGGTASAPQENDLVIVVYVVNSATDFDLSVTGYTEQAELRSTDAGAVNSETNLGVYTKIMTSTPDTEFTISATAADQGTAIAVHVWRGVNITTPMDVAATTAIGGNSVIPDPPSITPTTAGAMIVFMGGSGCQSPNTGIVTYGHPAGGNIFTDFRDEPTSDAAVGIASIPWTSGAYNPAAFSLATGSDHVDYSWAAATLALRPA